MQSELKRPGGVLARRTLHFFWIADCSYSMSGAKIQQLNHAIRDAIPAMQRAAEDNPQAEVMVRAIRFSSDARWHVANPTPVESFLWQDLDVSGETAMGKALSLVAGELSGMSEERGLPPVIVLITDGHPTDNFQTGLDALMNTPWGKRAIRIAIAIGNDADHGPLQKFIGNSERMPLQANNAEDLVKMIRWSSTVPLQVASAPPSQVKGASGDGVPAGPQPTVAADPDDVF